MELFDSMVVIVPGSHLAMLNILLLIAMIIFTIYSGILLGSTFFSVWYRSKYNKTGDKNHLRLSVDLIDVMTANPTMWFGFGLFPLIAIILQLWQLQSGTGATTPAILLFAFVIYAMGIVVTYFYKQSMFFNFFYGMFAKDGAHNSNDYHQNKVHEYNNKIEKMNATTGFWGVVLILVGVWVFILGTHYATDTAMWDREAMRNIFTAPILLKLAHFIAASFAMAGATFVFIKYYWDGGAGYTDEKYSSYARKVNTGIALFGLAAQPVFLALATAFTPNEASSYATYIYTALAVVFAFISANLLFTILKENDTNYIGYGFWTVLLIFVFVVFKDHSNIVESNSENVARISHAYEMEEAARLAASAGPTIYDGTEIYKTRCSACHVFDEDQATAPAYANVLEKYDGKFEDLAAFILNPVPRGNNNPITGAPYPPMPNQGINKGQAEAVAKYLWATFKGEEYVVGGGEEEGGNTEAAAH